MIALIAGSGSLTAQKLVIENLTPDQGLASNQTYQVLQDRYGYMWFACTGGLSLYDGYTYTNFTSSDGLAHSAITSLAEDPWGRIWVGTEAGIHAITHATMKNFFSRSGILIESFPALKPFHKSWISALMIDSDRKLWVSVLNKGLFMLDLSLKNDSSAFHQSLKKVDTDESLNKSFIKSLYDDGLGHVWACADQGIYCVNKVNFHIQQYTQRNGLRSNDVLCAFLDDQLILWIGTINGLNYLDVQSRNFLSPQLVKNSVTLNHAVQCFITDKEKNLWIGTRNGIIRRNKSDNTLTPITSANGLSDNYIRHIFQDREGLMWFATDAAGVNHLITEKFDNYTHENGLPSNVVRCFAEDSKGRKWIGTSKGLCVFDNQSFRSIPLGGQSSRNSIWVIYPDRQSRFWIGTQNGVYLLNENGQTLRHLTTADGLIDGGVRDLIIDSEERLWIATQFGISVYNPTNRRFTNYSASNGLPAVYVRSLSTDRFGNIWLGTRGGGLCKVVGTCGDSIRVQVYSTQNGFPNNTVSRIFHDIHGRMWVATNAGVIVMENDSDRAILLHHLSDKNGLPHNLVSAVHQDRKGNFWVCGDKGTTQVEYTTNDTNPFRILKYYNKKSGMVGEEFTTNNSIYIDRKGSFWFGLFGGITVYHPEKDVINDVPPFVYITNVSLIGAEEENPTLTPITGWLWGDTPLLAYNQNNLNFHYTALTYQDLRQTHYQYYLAGFDADWSPVTQKREVRYTNLPPGDYTFHVRAVTPNGLWSSYAAELTFHIAPAFWESWWFRAIMLAGFGLIIFIAVRIRILHIQKKNRELEQKIIERTYELTGKNEQLRELNQLKDEFLNIAAHDLRNPLNSILCTSRIILEDTIKKEYEADKYLHHDVNSIIHACQHMLELINNLLDLAKIEAGKIHLNLDRRDINLLIRELIESVEPMAAHKNINIHFDDIQQPVYIKMDKEKIWQALNNLFSNAIKFTDRDGAITISLNQQNDKVSISISDTGRGIPKEKLSKVFDKFSELSRTGTGGERGTGLGMAITKSIIELHGGNISVDSQVGKGTCFTFTLISSEDLNNEKSVS